MYKTLGKYFFQNILKDTSILFFPLLLLLPGCGKEPIAEKEIIRPVRAMKVNDIGGMKQRTFPGIAKATQEVELSFRVLGTLITLPVDIGDEVKQGDVVARLDPRDFEVNLRNVQSQLNEASAVARRADADYKRVKSVFEKDPGAISETAVDNALQIRDSARANVDALSASVATAKDRLDYTYLKAPFDGVIVTKYVENFEDVGLKQAIMRIVDDTHIEMIINIPQDKISLASRVKKVDVVFDPFPDHTLIATVKEIGTEASATTRTYPVTLIMDQPEDIKILPGMAGKTKGADIEGIEELNEVGLEVPLSTLFTLGESRDTYVWIINEQTNTVSKRKVTTDRLTDHGQIVTEGLESGELIATAGVHYLKEGQKIRILQNDAE